MDSSLEMIRAEVVGAAPPPPGVVPNFVDPASIGHHIIPYLATGLALSTSFLLMRIYTKISIVGLFGLDDVFIITSWIFIVVFSGLQATAPANGMGRHIWDVPLSMFSPGWLRLLLVLCLLYLPAMMFTKFAILIFFRRLSPQRIFRGAVYVVTLIVLGSYVSLGLTLIFACRPVAKSWDLSIKGGSCINVPAVYLATAGTNIATDFAILFLPIPMLWNLQLPKRQKFGLALIFAAGSMDCIVSIIRLRTLKPLLSSADSTYAVVEPSIWITVELHLSLICGCVLALKPFLRRHLPFLIGEHSPSSGSASKRKTFGYSAGSTVRSGGDTIQDRRRSGAVLGVDDSHSNHAAVDALHYTTFQSDVVSGHHHYRSRPSNGGNSGKENLMLSTPTPSTTDEENEMMEINQLRYGSSDGGGYGVARPQPVKYGDAVAGVKDGGYDEETRLERRGVGVGVGVGVGAREAGTTTKNDNHGSSRGMMMTNNENSTGIMRTIDIVVR